MNLSDIGTGLKIASQVTPKLAKLKDAANNIEAVFVKDLLKEMRKGVNKVSLGKSYGGEIYQDMLDEKLAESASKSGSFGIGTILYRQFSKDVMRQEAANVKLGQGAHINIEG